MSHETLQRRMQEVRRSWSTMERRQRAEVSRRRCAALLAKFDTPAEDPLAVWAAGAMSLSDIARIAG
jgi:hypothetical protein